MRALWQVSKRGWRRIEAYLRENPAVASASPTKNQANTSKESDHFPAVTEPVRATSAERPKRVTVTRDIFLALIPFGISQGWSMSGFPPKIILACMCWACTALALFHIVWITVPAKKPVRGALIVVAVVGLATWMWNPVRAEYAKEHPAPPPTLVTQKPVPFPSDPIQLVDLISPQGRGAMRNNSDETLFVSGIDIETHFYKFTDSQSYNTEGSIGPHTTVSFITPHPLKGGGGAWNTINPYPSSNWNEASEIIYRRFGTCSQPFPFVQDSIVFNQIVNNYKASHHSIPIGESEGTIFYQRGGEPMRKETIHLKALIFVQQGCKPS